MNLFHCNADAEDEFGHFQSPFLGRNFRSSRGIRQQAFWLFSRFIMFRSVMNIIGHYVRLLLFIIKYRSIIWRRCLVPRRSLYTPAEIFCLHSRPFNDIKRYIIRVYQRDNHNFYTCIRMGPMMKARHVPTAGANSCRRLHLLQLD